MYEPKLHVPVVQSPGTQAVSDTQEDQGNEGTYIDSFICKHANPLILNNAFKLGVDHASKKTKKKKKKKKKNTENKERQGK